MLGTHRLVDFSEVDRVAPVERGFQGVESRSPLLVAREQIAKQRQRAGLRFGRRRVLISRVGRGCALRHKLIAVVRLCIVSLDRDRGEGEPVRRILRRRGDCGGRELGCVVELRSRRRGSGGFAQVFRRLSLRLRPDRNGLGAQCLRQADRVARHIFARERLDVRGTRRAGQEHQTQGEQTQDKQHGVDPWADECCFRHRKERSDAAIESQRLEGLGRTPASRLCLHP